MFTLTSAPAAVKSVAFLPFMVAPVSAPAAVAPVAAPTVSVWPLVDFHPERDVLDTEAESYATWLAQEEEDAFGEWLAAHADAMAEDAALLDWACSGYSPF